MAVNDITVPIKISPKAHQRLHSEAKQRGYTATAYAQLLFDAAFSARLGQLRGDEVADRDLDAQVTMVFACAGQGDPQVISKATGLGVPLVERILAGWKKQARAK